MFSCSFDFHRNAAHHQIDLIGLGRYELVSPAQQVGKAALHFVSRYAAHPDFVGYEYKSRLLRSESQEFFFHGLQRLLHLPDSGLSLSAFHGVGGIRDRRSRLRRIVEKEIRGP